MPGEVTDRGPYIDGRILDLSERAAFTLGMHAAGLGKVDIKPIDLDATMGPLPVLVGKLGTGQVILEEPLPPTPRWFK